MSINSEKFNFDLHEAYNCLKLCEISYYSMDVQIKDLKKLKFKKFKSFQKENTYAFSCKKDGILYLVFRGSDNAQDILDDLDVKKVREGNGKVHAGYKRHLDRVWKDVKNYLSKQKYKKLVVTGHSMGGAVGQIVNYRLPKTVGYYFGSARSVNSKIYYDQKSYVYQIQDKYDLVTNLPPKFIFDFRLTGTKFVLEYGKLYNKNQSLFDVLYTIFYMIAFLIIKLFSLFFNFSNFMSDLLVINHKIADYRRNLEAYIKKIK
jgi:hypothetical protein